MLIVDANEFARSFTANICRGLHFGKISTAAEPEQAFNHLKTLPVDAVVAEWLLPGGGGDAFIREIRRSANVINPCVPIIILTAESNLQTVAAARDAGTTEFLTRPLILKQFLSRLTHVFTQPRAFVRSADYFGPDRRRRQRPFAGPDRRKSTRNAANIKSTLLAQAAAKVASGGGLTFHQLVTAGEQVIAEEAVKYGAVRRKDSQDLAALVLALKQLSTPEPALIEQIYLKSHDLKGMGRTFGYPLLTESGDSLCNLLWRMPRDRLALPITLQAIETHATVMSLIVDQEIHDDGGETGKELIAGLQTLAARGVG